MPEVVQPQQRPRVRIQTNGNLGGRIQTKDANGVPFTTNATGVATGLNADKVDGKDATDFAATGDLLFAAVAADGHGDRAAGRRPQRLARRATNTYTVTFDTRREQVLVHRVAAGRLVGRPPGVASGGTSAPTT